MSSPADRGIRLLDTRLANQIAAGEVVERPASVLKELLENSLDAGAGRIDVELERGGVGLIRVRDDGRGIAREELPLALCRHATSKLYTPEELERIGTLGFRGEALAAIASVSRFTLISRRPDDPHAWSIEPGGTPVPASLAAPGTTVEVRELFHNVPARRKFLRGTRTELTHLEEVARRIALSRFGLALSVRHDGRRLLDLRPAEGEAARLRRVSEACGAPFAREARPVELAAAGMALHGWVLAAELARPQSDLQYFFVNGRVVRDRLIAHAVRSAYGEGVAEGRYPAYLLFLEIDPGAVDVNVHPTKHEVRFRDARMTHDFIAQGVRRALAAPTLFVQTPPPVVEAGLFEGTEEAAEPPPARVAERVWTPPPAGAPEHRPYAATARPAARPSPGRVAEEAGLYDRLFPPRPMSGAAAPAAQPPAMQRPPQPAPASAAARVLGRVGRFLVAADVETLLLVDVPAALSALLASRLAEGFAAAGVTSQPLLVPEAVALSAADLALAEGRAEALERLGYQLDPMGTGSVVVRAAPALLRRVPAAAQVEALLPWLRGAEPPPFAALAALGGDELPEARDPQRLLAALPSLEAPERLVRRLDPEALAQLLAGGRP